ncbi:MAG: hypothetical protein KIH89_004590 [Candidatus Shapirobacteria bacterium]|nr:hypothetical protein [Candidatus Shapirobacteria bacterium]
MIIPKEVRQKPLEYLILGIIFFIGLILYFFAPFDAHGKRIIVYLMAANYFFWSLYHHYKRGDLSLSIIVEYLIIALLGITLLTLSFF